MYLKAEAIASLSLGIFGVGNCAGGDEGAGARPRRMRAVLGVVVKCNLRFSCNLRYFGTEQ